VRDQAMFGTGQLPKFADDLFHTTTDYWLVPTAEVPLTNLVREQFWTRRSCHFRFTAYTPCFRAEAGAAGKDTRGMIDAPILQSGIGLDHHAGTVRPRSTSA